MSEERRKKRKKVELICKSILAGVIILLAGGVYVVITKLPSQTTEVHNDAEGTSEVVDDIIQDLIENETDLPTEAEDVILEPTADELFQEFLDESIAAMSLEEKVAGLFVVTPESLTGVTKVTQAGEGTKTALETYPVGGIVYSEQNFEDQEQFDTMLTNTIGYSSIPLFLTVDSSEITSANLNWKLGPIADIIIGEDSYLDGIAHGTDTSAVAAVVLEEVTLTEYEGISSTIMNFPGTGDLSENPNEVLMTSDREYSSYEEQEFGIYLSAFNLGADFVQVSHMYAPGLGDDMNYASMSERIVTDILRNSLGFDEIIITGPMNAPVITEYYTQGDAAIRALRAGNDMIFAADNFVEAYDAVLIAVQSGLISEERINDSLERIYRVKYEDKLEELESSSVE